MTRVASRPGPLALAKLANHVMSEAKYAAYEALGPFCEIIMRGLSGVVDGDHYFDTIAEDATFEFLYEFPGWPRAIRGRAELMTAHSCG